MRLFIALEFSRRTRQALYESAAAFSRFCAKASLTKEENFHLTLVFLGEVPPERLPDVKSAMDQCRAAPVDLTITGPGRFRQRDGDTVWRGAEPAGELQALYTQLCSALEVRGFAAEDREYRPHVTLARRVRLQSGHSFEEFAALTPPLRQRIDAVTLMHSHSINGKLTYTPVYRVRLDKATPAG